jgi:hypothetical protein
MNVESRGEQRLTVQFLAPCLFSSTQFHGHARSFSATFRSAPSYFFTQPRENHFDLTVGALGVPQIQEPGDLFQR